MGYVCAKGHDNSHELHNLNPFSSYPYCSTHIRCFTPENRLWNSTKLRVPTLTQIYEKILRQIGIAIDELEGDKAELSQVVIGQAR